MAVDEVSDSPDERPCVEVSVDPDPGSLVVHGVEGVQLVVEEQQLLTVAAGCATHPLLLTIYPAIAGALSRPHLEQMPQSLTLVRCYRLSKSCVGLHAMERCLDSTGG